MRTYFFLCLMLGLLSNALLFGQKPITLEAIWQEGAFNARGVPGFNFQKDGQHYTRLNAGRIEQYDMRTGNKTATLLDAATLKTTAEGWNGTFDDYTFSPNEQKMLLGVGTESIYRWSTQAHYFVWQNGTLTRLYEGGKQRYPTFSPDGSKVAFVANNNLFVRDLTTQKLTQVTADGKANAIINGASDWVYEEEFELVRAFEWSKDGQRLGFLRFDEGAVPEFTMERYNNEAYPNPVTFKYPKVGATNATVSAWLYDLANDKTTLVQTGATAQDYLPRIYWLPDGRFCVTKMNRLQNHLQLLAAHPITGVCQSLLEEHNSRYVELRDPDFLPDGQFVWQSERSGYNHLYLYDPASGKAKALTKGNWDVTDYYGIDAKNGLVYYQAAAVNPMQREIYQINIKGKSRKKLSGAAGFHQARFSNTFEYFTDIYSTLNSAPQYAVYDRNGKLVRKLEQNDALNQRLRDYGNIPAKFFQFTTPEKVTLNGWMIQPTDPKYQNQKLPVLMFVYGGPGSQQVTDQWKGANYGWFQYLAQQGYVVACVDNRGTGARGEDFKKITYKELGKYETIDQIAAARYLGTLPFVDAQRIGIFGWSYGGYMASSCILKGADVFKAAIAVAPVTNWKWYDSVYTERYMQTDAENAQGFEDNSPVNFAPQLKGHYFLAHGLADDNVHFQHAAEMARALIAANKQFDYMVYPNRNHGISGGNARIHLFTKMTNFLEKNLKEQAPPKP